MFFQKKVLFSLLILLFLQGCGSTPFFGGEQDPIGSNFPFFFSKGTPTPTAIPPTATFTPDPTSTPIYTPTITPTPTVTPPSMSVKRVIIVSFDGLRADAVAAAPMKTLMSLMSVGAYTLKARTINYAVTLPGHASMISGLCQSKHGIWWDTPIWGKGYSKGVDIFDLAHAAGLRTVMIVNKEKMRQLAEPETTDVYKLVYASEAKIINTAIAEFANGFDLMFIHIGSPDYSGHTYGWMSGTYLKALREGDSALGELVLGMEQYGIRQETLLIVTADHGGHEKEHVGNVIEDLEIPWVAYGPGIQHVELTNPVSVMDTAATAAYALELPLQPDWDGLPVYEAFGLSSPTVHPPNFRICK